MARQEGRPTPGVRLFTGRQLINTYTHCCIGFERPIDVEALKSAVRSSPVLRIPRFTSLLTFNPRNGSVSGWRKVPSVDVDRHVIVVEESMKETEEESDLEAVNRYVAEISSARMEPGRPLWELHVLVAHRFAVLRSHHAVGDGLSFMSMLEACFGATEDQSAPGDKSVRREWGKEEGITGKGRKPRLWERGRSIGCLWYNLKFVSEYVARVLLVSDQKTIISGGIGVEKWPTRIAAVTFSIEDMKLIKVAIPNATINDVFFTVVAVGLSRYLERRSPHGLPKALRVTCVSMANVREKSGFLSLSEMMTTEANSTWGNKIGNILLRIDCNKAASSKPALEYLKSAKKMLDRKKKSVEARFSYKLLSFSESFLGQKRTCGLAYKMLCNTTLLISNMVGPRGNIAIAGNPVTYLGATLSGMPHALAIHLLSYRGKANMQFVVARDIIPDPEFLAKCFEDALHEMKDAAALAAANYNAADDDDSSK